MNEMINAWTDQHIGVLRYTEVEKDIIILLIILFLNAMVSFKEYFKIKHNELALFLHGEASKSIIRRYHIMA